MRALAAFIMRGRGQAALAIAALTILSWAFAPANLLSGAAVALPTLRRGTWEGGGSLALAAPLVVLVGGFLLGSPLEAAGYALALWIPVWLIAVLLRESGQLAVALAGAAILGLLVIMGIYGFVDDPAGLWLDELRRLARPVLEQNHSEAETEVLWRGIMGLSRYLVGAIAAGSVLSVVLSLLIGRWWQALLFNPGGFRREFLDLRLPPVSGYLWLALLVLAWITGSELGGNLTMPSFVPFLLTGFAVLHALFSRSSAGGFWLVGMYLALIFVSPLIMVVMLIGFSDLWINWRCRFSKT